MLSTHQLRDALRKGLFLQLKREKPTCSNEAALRLARMKEKQAWKRRDDVTVSKLERIVTAQTLDNLEKRFQEYFHKAMRPPPKLATPREARVQ